MNVTHLKRATLLGAFSWTAGGTVLSYLLALVRSIVVARLLYPADYGLFGLATGVISALSVFTDFSFSSKIMVTVFSSEDEERTALDTVWTVSLIRGALLSLLIIGCARPVASWFRDDRLFTVLLVISAASFLSGLENVGLVKFRKDLAFRALVAQKQVAEVITFGATVVLAFWTRNYLALVFSQVISSFVIVILSFWLCPYRPRITLDRDAFTKCFSFGKHLFVVGVLTFITSQFDALAIGRFLGANAVGAYVLAYRLAMLPVDIMGRVLNSVLFPAYAKVRLTDPGGLASIFAKLNAIGATFVLLAVGPLALAPVDIIRVLYGDRWNQAGQLLTVLAFTGLFRALAHTVSPWLVAIGRPDLDAKCKMVESVVFVGLTLFWVTRVGAIGAAWASLVSYSAAYLMRVILAVRLCPTAPALLASLAQPLAAAVIALGAGAVLRVSGAPALVAVLVYLPVFVAISYLTNAFFQTEVKNAAHVLHRWIVPQEG